MNCHFCEKELPEKDCTHIIYAESPTHARDPEFPLLPVCRACMHFHKLTMRALRRER